MKIPDIIENVKQFFSQYIAPVYKVVSIRSGQEGWEIITEVIEEKEYMVDCAKDELIGKYKVMMNPLGEIISFSRLNLRYRSDLIAEDEVES